VIVTVLEDLKELGNNDYGADVHTFDNLVGVIDVREDGSKAYDNCIIS